MKIGIDQIPCPAYWVFQKLPLSGAKDDHFSFFQRSYQLGLNLEGEIRLPICQIFACCLLLSGNSVHTMYIYTVTRPLCCETFFHEIVSPKTLGIYIHFPQQFFTQNSKLWEYHKNEAMVPGKKWLSIPLTYYIYSCDNNSIYGLKKKYYGGFHLYLFPFNLPFN